MFEKLQGYLNEHYDYFCINRKDINSLLNSCWNFQTLKKENFYWKLNRATSTAYYFTDFKPILDAKLSNVKNQLQVDLSHFREGWERIILYANSIDISTLGNLHTLNLNSQHLLEDVSALGNLHILSLRCCTNVVDVSALGNVHNLDLGFVETLRMFLCLAMCIPWIYATTGVFGTLALLAGYMT
jgi:hypothetical protein